MKCERCQHWTVKRVTAYGGGEEIENWKAPPGKGACAMLGIETTYDFGCNRHIDDAGSNHVEITLKDGHPWQHFIMTKCPDCGGKGDGASGHRCAGTGLVRLYDDGYVGDEQTRMHPKEKDTVVPSACPKCAAPTEPIWQHCPACGGKLWKVAKTEVINDELAGLPPSDADQQLKQEK